jgi:small subunit ribosomal protein S9
MSDSLTVTTPATPAPAAAPAPKKPKGTNPYIWGTGRRKTAVARVRIKAGTGKFMVNEREVGQFFCVERDRESVHNPLKVTETIVGGRFR